MIFRISRISSIGNCLSRKYLSIPNTNQSVNRYKYFKINQYSSSEEGRKRLMFRALNTGMKELDIILSEFIKSNPDVLDTHRSEFESFLDMETDVIYDIVMGKIDHESNIGKRIRSYLENESNKSK